MTPREFLDSQNIDYTENSSGWLKFCCVNPGHQDNHPSMSIREDSGGFNCFGCGCRGNFSQFIELVTGTPLDVVKTKYRPTISKSIPRGKKEDPEIIITGNLKDPLKNKEVREWLRNYGILEDAFIKDFGIKYSTYSEAIAKHLIGTPKEKEKGGWTKIENRIVTPMMKKGKIVNLEARTLLSEEERGEIKKVLYVKGGNSSYLFNWDNIDLDKDLVIVESVKNLCKIWNVTHNVVASYHAIPGREQLDLLRQCRGNLINFCDSDEAGLGKIDLVSGEVVKKGSIQALAEGLGKPFKLCYAKGFLPGTKKNRDGNDCSLEEISFLLRNSVWYEDHRKSVLDSYGILRSTEEKESFGTVLPKKRVTKKN